MGTAKHDLGPAHVHSGHFVRLSRIQRVDRGCVQDGVAACQRAFDCRGIGYVPERGLNPIHPEQPERGRDALGDPREDAIRCPATASAAIACEPT